MKIVINGDYGGFGLSDKAKDLYETLTGQKLVRKETKWDEEAEAWEGGAVPDYELSRNDPALVQVVETLGEEANGSFAALKVVEIPDDVEWEIEEYDGRECVAEAHRTWC